MLRILKNTEIKLYLIIIVVIHLIIALLAMTSSINSTQKLQRAIIEERVALLGIIMNSNPELEEDVIPFLTEKATPKEIQLGEEVAKQYGIYYDLPIEGSPLVTEHHNRERKNILKYALISLISTLVVGIGILSYTYCRVRKFSKYAEAIVEGDFETIKESQEEGDFAILTLQYNQMAKRLRGSLDNLNNEKLYLKDTISDISHQLKTPLSSVKMFNELLIDGEIEDFKNSKEFLNKSQTQIERMEWLIKNLLKMAKLETNSVEFNNNIIPMEETIDKAITPLQEKWKDKQQEVVINYMDKPEHKHDQGWLSEAISNIVKNAIEHTPVQGTIAITMTETPLAIKIQISNEGKQIDQEDIPNLFERFYKGRNNSSPHSTGIGLALAKAIVENQNGAIEVRNESRGPSFTIYLYKYDSF